MAVYTVQFTPSAAVGQAAYPSERSADSSSAVSSALSPPAERFDPAPSSFRPGLLCVEQHAGLANVPRVRILHQPLPQHLRPLLLAEFPQPLAQLRPLVGQDRNRQ